MLKGISDEEMYEAICGTRSPTKSSLLEDSMTYQVAARLSRGRAGVKTSSALARLKRMELEGKVKRVKSIYAVQLCWSVTDEAITS
ncbi:hypothetical protein [Rahnella inusitata]|jgi:hypothetical protein|uniref:hypothetical protein n=1 Tax=Rahnella inusitata TaxID=58169 RepID=UPI0039BDDE89